MDGRLKVTGGATLRVRDARREGTTAYGYVVQASIAKGRIRPIDTTAAEQTPGVLLVLTYRNAARTGPRQLTTWPHPVLTGPEVDATTASRSPLWWPNTFEQARAAAYLVRVDL